MWDGCVAAVNGHPLQSALWGNARFNAEGIQHLFLSRKSDAGPSDGLARVEIRMAPFGLKIAWIPRGPIFGGTNNGEACGIQKELRRHGFIACICDPYTEANAITFGQPRTIWLDLTAGSEALFRALDSQWRYGARRAVREGVVVRPTTVAADVTSFYRMCSSLSESKGFALPGSEALMQELIRSSSMNGPVKMTLYVGEVEGVIAGGALIATSGSHIHYLWGASDRCFSKYRVSEAVQWQVIQDGVAAGMTRYDLEGIDPIGNPGVYEFKRKMGGREVVLQGMETTPLSWIGSMAISLGRRLGRLV